MSATAIALTSGLSLLVGILVGYVIGRAESDDARK